MSKVKQAIEEFCKYLGIGHSTMVDGANVVVISLETMEAIAQEVIKEYDNGKA